MDAAIKKLSLAAAAVTLASSGVFAHLCPWHPSMYGFNVTASTFSWDNRPMTPLMNLPFDKWWFHGHLGYPPNDGDVFEFPAGGSAIMQIACNKGLTDYWRSSEGTTDIRQPDGFPCPGPGQGYGPGQSQSSLHTTSFADVAGSAIAIVDEDDVSQIKPEDFVVFTVNTTSPWTTNTSYQIPAEMPPCTKKYCHCAWFWVHNDDSGSEQNYMTGFRCKITGTTSGAKTIGKGSAPRFCPNDPKNCTVGAMNPFYWYQAEQNNMPNGQYDPPTYGKRYGFPDGAQNYIFEGAAAARTPPSTTSTTTTAAKSSAAVTTPASNGSTSSIASSNSTPQNSSSNGDPSSGSSGGSPPTSSGGNGSTGSGSTGYGRTESGNGHPPSGKGGPIEVNPVSKGLGTSYRAKHCKHRTKGAMHKHKRRVTN